MYYKNDTIEKKYQIAKNFFENGILKSAKELFIELILKDPFKWQFWFALASIYQQEKNYTQATISYNMSIILNPNNGFSYFYLAECFLSLDKKPQAIKNLELAKKHTEDMILKDRIQILIKQNLK